MTHASWPPPPPALLPTGELLAAVQGGFRPDHYRERGLGAAVPLHSSVLLADSRRLLASHARTAATSSRGAGGGGGGGGLFTLREAAGGSIATGQLLVCKARLGSCLVDAGAVAAPVPGQGASQGVAPEGRAAACSGGLVTLEAFPGATAVYKAAMPEPLLPQQQRQPGQRQLQPDLQQKQQRAEQARTYYVFDAEAVLPEYLITFEYALDRGSPLASAAGGGATTGAALEGACFEASPEQLRAAEASVSDPALRAAAAPLLPWLALAGAAAGGDITRMCGCAEEASWDCLVAEVEALLEAHGSDRDGPGSAAAPLPAARLLLRLRAAAAAGGALVRLDAGCCGLRDGDLSPLAALPSLRDLVLAFNELTSLQASAPPAFDVPPGALVPWGHA